MKLNGEGNIILDNDVTVTRGKNIGKPLSDVIDEQEAKLENMASNVKWLYKYGGVGSGSGGGGSTTSWNVQVSRADTGDIIRDGIPVNFGKEDVYGIKVQIYNGGTSTFKVTFGYTNSRGKQTTSDVIWSEQGFLTQKALLLDLNGNLNVTILNQDTQEIIAYVVPFVVTSYKFTLQYVYSDTLTPVNFTNNTIFMSEVKERGIKVLFTSNVSVNLNFSSYKYVDWRGNEVTVDTGEECIEGKMNKQIYLDLIPDGPDDEPGDAIKEFLSDNNNARFKQFLLDITIILEGNTVPETIGQLYLKDNLIPSTMFLKVTVSGGMMFEAPQEEYPESGKFLTGTIPFTLTPYDGAYNPNKRYRLDIYDNNNKLSLPITQLSDQTEQVVPLQINISGQHKLKFVITYGTSYEVSYYIFVKENESSFDWYENGKIIQRQAYYRQNLENGVVGVSGITPTTQIEMTLNSPLTSYNFTITEPDGGLNGFDQFLSVGLQYSEINDTSTPIMRFNVDDNEEGTVFVYQDKILVSTSPGLDEPSGEVAEIFFPMVDSLDQTRKENYHLISFYKRYEARNGESYYKTVGIYLDGVLEAEFSNFTAIHKNYRGVTFYPGNYFCNLFEYSALSHNVEDDKDYYTRSSENQPPFLTDNDIVGYFYTYKEKMLNITISESENSLYQFFRTIREDKENYIKCSLASIQNIAIKSNVPVLLIHSVDNNGAIGTGGSGASSGYGKDNFVEWLSHSFEENDEISEVPITIEWKGDGDSELKIITKEGESNAASFFVTPQGSSTLGYRSKNLELIAPNSSAGENYSCVYSPNFNQNDVETFLPEASFTLKADVVDSSHTNNNAIASFVNDVTTHFEHAKQSGSTYADYIKNCLTGFPVLVFLHTAYKSDEHVQSVDVNQYYFLGIYNFNLGRKSYFNLGYKNVSNLSHITGGLKNGFHIYEISNSDNALLRGVVVGEIQGNNTFFDFSQADPTILFQNGDADKTYMFGDFVDGSGSDYANAKNKIRDVVKKISLAGGYTFTRVGKVFSQSALDNYGYNEGYSALVDDTPLNQVPSYQYKAVRTQTGTQSNYTFTRMADEDLGKESDLLNLLISNEETGNQPSLDYASLCEYYTTCMAFGLVDSVQKNLNIKSWNASSDATSETPLFYVAFYDMDTCLGVSNSGSKIDNFAFSDYWEPSSSENELGSVKVYRDYSPKNNSQESGGGNYFDVPSSYLFAIAKYGFFVKNGMSGLSAEDPLYYHPSNLWAVWRNRNKIPNPSTALEKQTGCLSNANSFTEKFYSSHLNNVPYSAFNYNYRYKYFIKRIHKTENSESGNSVSYVYDGYSYDDINFVKFYGRKVAYTKNWLEGRLHLLDAYFNLNGIADVMVENSVYAPFASSSLVDTLNEDIYVVKDIFSSSSTGNQYPNLDSYINVKSRSFAPLIMKSPNASSRYIFPKVPQSCRLHIKTSGNQYLLYGGSSLWVELDTINPFITSNRSLTVNSKYFTVLSGNNSTSCNLWNISTPSLKTISLTGANYSGALRFNSTDASVLYPNLTTVTISGTNIQLEINRAYVKTVNALNMKASSTVTIQNVSTLETFNATGNMNSLSVPAWKQDIYFPTNYQESSSSFLNCVNMTIANDVSKFPHNKLYIYNNDTLTTLSVEDFEEVVIEKCPKLSKIVINDRNPVIKKLHVIMPVTSTHTSFTIGNTTGVVDLSGKSSLSDIKFNYCKMEKVIMPPIDGMPLKPKAFYGCSQLKYFDGSENYYIDTTGIGSDGPATFYGCQNFTLMRGENDTRISPILVSTSTTSLKNVFCISDVTVKGSINKDMASKFLKDNCVLASNVTSITQMFFNQNIEYDKATLLSEYRSGTCSLPLSNFPKVTEASLTFCGNKISGYNRYMFRGLGTSSSSLTIDNVIGEYSSRDTYTTENERWESIGSTNYHILYTTSDFLYEILDRVTSLSVRGYSRDNSYLRFVDSYGNIIENPIQLGNVVFNNNGYYPIKLKSISQIEIFPGHNIDFENMFHYVQSYVDDQHVYHEHQGWIAAGESGLSLSSFFYYGGSAYKNFSHIQGLLGQIKLITATLVLNGFSQGTDGNERIDMFDFINWENISSCTNLFNSQYASLGFYKFIRYSDFMYVWGKILSAISLTGIGYLFQNCVILCDDEPSSFVLDSTGTKVNTKITGTNHLFENCSLRDSLNAGYNEFPMNIKHSFLHCLPSLKSVPYMFRNTLWGNPIPFDFFNKRVEKTGNVYVDNGNERIPATLYKYEYTSDMTDMIYCFRNVTFPDTCKCFVSTASYNEGSFKKAKVVDRNGNEYATYYNSLSVDATEYEVKQGTEIDDAESAERQNATEYFSVVRPLASNAEFTNFSAAFDTSNNTSGCYVTPDIFYGMALTGTSRQIEYSLGITTGTPSATGMSGLIPKNLLKNVKSLSPLGLLSNLNLLPWYIDEYNGTYGATEVTYKCYCYVPSKFTEYSMLEGVFNFHLILPNTGITEHSKYFVLHSDSIPSNCTSLSNGLPGATDDNVRSSLIGQTAHSPNPVGYDFGICYNIMLEEHYNEIPISWEYEPVVPYDVSSYVHVEEIPDPVTEESENHIYVTIGGSQIYYDKVVIDVRREFKPIEGIDMIKFTKLKLDNLINVPLSFFINGNVFKSGTLTREEWSSRKYLATTNGFMMTIGYGSSWTNGLSRPARLPFPQNNDRFARTTITQSSAIKIAKDSIEGGYNESYDDNYPNITFID